MTNSEKYQGRIESAFTAFCLQFDTCLDCHINGKINKCYCIEYWKQLEATD